MHFTPLSEIIKKVIWLMEKKISKRINPGNLNQEILSAAAVVYPWRGIFITEVNIFREWIFIPQILNFKFVFYGMILCECLNSQKMFTQRPRNSIAKIAKSSL
jgi:hypothetical protein